MRFFLIMGRSHGSRPASTYLNLPVQDIYAPSVGVKNCSYFGLLTIFWYFTFFWRDSISSPSMHGPINSNSGSGSWLSSSYWNSTWVVVAGSPSRFIDLNFVNNYDLKFPYIPYLDIPSPVSVSAPNSLWCEAIDCRKSCMLRASMLSYFLFRAVFILLFI